jgi:hypothetical protein
MLCECTISDYFVAIYFALATYLYIFFEMKAITLLCNMHIALLVVDHSSPNPTSPIRQCSVNQELVREETTLYKVQYLYLPNPQCPGYIQDNKKEN